MSTVNYEGHLATVVNFTNIFCQFSIDIHVQISKPNCKRIKVAQNTSILKAGHKKLMKLTAVHPNSIWIGGKILKEKTPIRWTSRFDEKRSNWIVPKWMFPEELFPVYAAGLG